MRVLHFQTIACEDEDATFDDSALLLPMIQSFIAQNDKEMAELAGERRPGRPPIRDEARMKQQKEEWQRELRSGFWMPDMRDAETLKKLREWDEDWAALGQMKFIRTDEKGNIKDSSFPPKKG